MMHNRFPGIGDSKRKKPARTIAEPIGTCDNEVALIADYVTSSLDSGLLLAFEKHLEACPDCVAFLQTYKKTIEATRVFLKTQSWKDLPPKLVLRPPNGYSQHK
jgi:anti-sigma factor RsiW